MDVAIGLSARAASRTGVFREWDSKKVREAVVGARVLSVSVAQHDRTVRVFGGRLQRRGRVNPTGDADGRLLALGSHAGSLSIAVDAVLSMSAVLEVSGDGLRDRKMTEWVESHESVPVQTVVSVLWLTEAVVWTTAVGATPRQRV